MSSFSTALKKFFKSPTDDSPLDIPFFADICSSFLMSGSGKILCVRFIFLLPFCLFVTSLRIAGALPRHSAMSDNSLDNAS